MVILKVAHHHHNKHLVSGRPGSKRISSTQVCNMGVIVDGRHTWKVAWGLKVTSLWGRCLGKVQCGRSIRLEWVSAGAGLGLGGSFNLTVCVNVLSSGDTGRVEGWCNDSRPPSNIRSGAGVTAGSRTGRTFNVVLLPRPSNAVVCSSTAAKAASSTLIDGVFLTTW